MFVLSSFLDLLFFLFFVDFFQKWSILEPPSKSDGVKNGTRNRPMGTKRCKQSISTSSLLRSRNNLAPQTPPETPQVIFSMIFEGFSHIAGLMLKDVQWLLASLLILNSGSRTKRQTPETMQNSSRDRAGNF